jgi:phospholipase C
LSYVERLLAVAIVGSAVLVCVGGGVALAHGKKTGDNVFPTTTPIKHLVVIFQENVSFDHYFGTYPQALNPAGEPSFEPSPDTASVNGLNAALLTPLDRSQAVTCDQDHNYKDEQRAFDLGLMDSSSKRSPAARARTRASSWTTTTGTP